MTETPAPAGLVLIDHSGAILTELPENDGPIMCPAKGCSGELVEADTAVRYNRLTVQDGLVFAATGDGDWYADDPRWQCDQTGWPIAVEFDLQITDYS